MSTNAMNFGPAWMRGDASRQQARAETEGRQSPSVHPNGSAHSLLGLNTSFSPVDASLHPPGVNGSSSVTTPHGRTSSFSYSSILASAPSTQSPGGDPHNGNNGATANHDKPFKYTREEMLNIWKTNSSKFKTSGIPLEFEKHEAFTSEEPLDPALLTEMTPAEREAFNGPMNSDKPDITAQGRLDRGGRQFSPKTERFQTGLGSGRSGVAPRNRTSSRGEPGASPYSTTRPQIRSVKSRDYFTGAFGGASAFSGGNSPPERDLWGSATKKGSFDENGKFVVADDDDKNVQALEAENKLDDSELLNLGDQVEDFPTETYESPTQVLDTFSLPAGGRSTSRFSSFAIPDESSHQEQHVNQEDREPRLDQLSTPVYADDHEDDVLNDILSMAADPRAMSPPRQMDRLTSRFAQQSLAEPSGYGAFGGVGPFDADPIRRDSTSMSQFFGGGQPQPPVPKAGLFEHPVVPQQPALPPVPPQTTRVMIMADKLKWVYKDPHGQIQGPFTGLEMHEWYRGGYFHSTLEVRREDDVIWEQLQNLVKRIGNQREPFLVPLPSKTQTQPIPPRSTTTLSAWNTTLFGEGQEEANPWIAPAPAMPAATISGTTLTADQQNALERRKQEEQYMLVRQRELAAQQQLSHAPVVHPLLHQQSPQHFVPSPAAFGGFNPMHPLPLGITHHVHTPAPVQVQTLPALDTLRTGGTLETPTPPQQVPSPLERQAQGGLGFQQQPPNRGFMSPWGAGPLGPLSPGMVQMQIPQTQESYMPQQYTEESQFAPERKSSVSVDTPAETFEDAVPATVLETVDQSRTSSVSAASAKADVASPVTQIEPEKSEAKQEEDFIPETIASSETADDTIDHPTVTPSPARVAPWATPQKKDESKKSLSLKQIQEIEAKRAAEQARRIAAERQLLLQQQAAAAQLAASQQPTVQPGLPQGSTWGSVAAKGWTSKTPTPVTSTPGKKTMAQIQREEEEAQARLARGTQGAGALAPLNKGYAGAAAVAAAKPAMPTAWTMVGPGGRPQPGRPIHSGGINPAIPVAGAVAAASPVRASPVRSVSVEQTKPVVALPVKASPQAPATGVEDFQKWCRSQLKSLNGVNYDEIYQMLLSLPPNESASQEIISDTIYTHSPTLDGRHFAEEFLKRRKVLGSALDSTVSTGSSTPSNSGSGSGWNEVLKKDKSKDASGEWNSAFKVVAGKKGRRRG